MGTVFDVLGKQYWFCRISAGTNDICAFCCCLNCVTSSGASLCSELISATLGPTPDANLHLQMKEHVWVSAK